MTILGHITPEVINIFLSEAADLLGQWDEACFSLEIGGDSREAMLWVSRSLQSLRRASRGIGLEDFAQTLTATDEYLRLVLRAGVVPPDRVSSVLMLAYGILSRWIVGLRTDPLYREDLSELNDAIRLQKSFVQKMIDDEKQVANSKVVISDLDQADSTPAIQNAPFRDTAIRSLLEAGANTALAESDARIRQLIDIVAHISSQQMAIEKVVSNSRDINPQMRRMVHNMGRMIAELSESAVGLRWVPLEGLFERLAMFALESAQCKGISIQVDIDAQSTLIDKGTLGSLWEPISKLVRWTVEMGFETPEERVRDGKLPIGMLRINASQKNSIVKISVEDDGRGQGEGDFTRAGQGTQGFVARAREMLHEISATLNVHVSPGRLTRFEIEIPAAPRLLELVVVNCSEQLYAVPIHVLEEIIEPGCFTTHKLRGDKQLIEYNGKLFPFVNLVELLEKTSAAMHRRVQATVAIEKGHVLLMRMGRDSIAVGVDQVSVSIRTLVTPLQLYLEDVKGLSGTLIAGTGDPVLVVDLLELVNSFLGLRHEREVA